MTIISYCQDYCSISLTRHSGSFSEQLLSATQTHQNKAFYSCLWCFLAKLLHNMWVQAKDPNSYLEIFFSVVGWHHCNKSCNYFPSRFTCASFSAQTGGNTVKEKLALKNGKVRSMSYLDLPQAVWWCTTLPPPYWSCSLCECVNFSSECCNGEVISLRDTKRWHQCLGMPSLVSEKW